MTLLSIMLILEPILSLSFAYLTKKLSENCKKILVDISGI